jgi:hypothetical protein
MRVAHLGLAALVLTACRGTTEDQIAALQQENDALTGELAALSETVDALAAAAEAQQGEVTSLNDEIDALTGLELTDLLADVASIDSRLAEIEAVDIASEGWVTDQGFGLQADIQANTTRLDALDAEQQQQDASIASNASIASGNSTTLVEQSAAIGDVSTAVTELAATVGAVQSTVSGNTQSSATNAAAISELQTTTQNNQTAIADVQEALGGSTEAFATLNQRVDDLQASTDSDVDALVDIIDGVQTDAQASRDLLSAAIGNNESRLTSVEGDLSDTFDVLAEAIDDVDEKVLGGYPALFEYQGIGTDYDARIAQGRSGLLLQSSGGGFSFSGYSGLNYTGGISRVWTVTWYIENPSASPVSVDWTMCRGDSPTVLLDGVAVASPTDLDGRCEDLNALFTVPPGVHTVQIRYIDTNNWLEGMGVTNAWMVENDLTTDWDGLKAALELGVDR